ncbi:MAG TPA: dienelactone hydrolase family protein [Candidatus Baltobacteraceae bacterium]|nr:dienelactone hydrolase family protein [Candidatus Baltobacteraceae bacterium]
MIGEQVTIDAPNGAMQAYAAHVDGTPRPAVIVLPGVYGYDEQLRTWTATLASFGFGGLALDYLRGRDATAVAPADVRSDVAAAQDWLDRQPWVRHGKLAVWGFGAGGGAAFLAATLPGLQAAIAFYGQSIARAPNGVAENAPLAHVKELRAPLLLVFGGHDEQIGPAEIEAIRTELREAGKPHEIDVYPTVGHSFFREDLGTIASREIADAWDRVLAFLRRCFA